MLIKRIYTLVLAILILCCFCSCDPDPYKGQRPIDFENSVWTCNELDMHFDQEQSSNNILLYEDVSYNFNFLFTAGAAGVIVYEIKQDENRQRRDLFYGQCEFSKESFKIHITEIVDSRLSDMPALLTFIRIQ